MRSLVPGLALCCWSSVALSQGVPVTDPLRLGQEAAKLQSQVQDAGVQDGKRSSRDRLAALSAEQLKILEDIRTSLGASGSAGGGFSVGSGLTGPMEKRLFGEGRETVEMMIVQVAEEYAGSSGVQRAGLSATEWRCLFQSLVKQESRFQVAISSPVGAYGLTQLMPGTASDLGVDRYDPLDNLRGGAKYLSQQLATFGDIRFALAAYNAGPGAVRKYGGVPPYEETQGYVASIGRFYADYLSRVGGATDLGTLSTQDAALAENGNTADAGSHFANIEALDIAGSITRLEDMIRRIDQTDSLVGSINLNTEMRAELGRLMVLRWRARSARLVAGAFEAERVAADLAAERKFSKIGEVE